MLRSARTPEISRNATPSGLRAPARRRGHPALGAAVAAALCVAGVGCSPIVRPATFEGAPERVADATLRGPFDGQVVDVTTAEPIAGATVTGVWSYDRGDGLIGPWGSETTTVTTDAAGRYRIPSHKPGGETTLRPDGQTVRLVAFHLVIYKRGFVGYRSDRILEGGARTDFTQRHNRVQLRKWRETDSHADHLLFLQAPPAILQLARWERESANVDLYRVLGGGALIERLDDPTDPETLQLLDASEVLPREEVRRRTGYTEAFALKELTDLARTHFYHGVHLEAVDREEVWDVAYRVWKDPPGGLEPVIETFEATLPDTDPTPEITDETWLYEGEQVRAVAFLDREANVAVLLTCGVMQCVDIETAIVLARYVHDHLDRLELVDVSGRPAPEDEDDEDEDEDEEDEEDEEGSP
jgi:hypothetical protein